MNAAIRECLRPVVDHYLAVSAANEILAAEEADTADVIALLADALERIAETTTDATTREIADHREFRRRLSLRAEGFARSPASFGGRHLVERAARAGLEVRSLRWAEVWFDPRAACIATGVRERIQASRGGLEPVCFRSQARMSDPTADRSVIRMRKRVVGELIEWLMPVLADGV